LVFKITGNIYLEPIIDLAQKATEIKNNKLNLLKKNYNNFEFNQLKQGFNKMIKGVEQKEKLESFVSKDVKQTVNKNTSVELKPGGEKINATVFFASIENFNQKLKNLPPKKLISILKAFLNQADHIAEKYQGVLNKSYENTVMLIFREIPGKEPNSLRAAKAAINFQKNIGNENFTCKISISTGPLISGRIGDKNGKLDFTVIGDTVNLAARLKGEEIASPQTNVVISPSTIRALKGKARLKFIKKVSVKGKKRDFPIYELLELRK
jgi:class 3 adenylate cyclase